MTGVLIPLSTRLLREAAIYKEAHGINTAGAVVGMFVSSTEPGVGHGFVKAGDTLSQIDVPGANRTEAYGINSAGEIVGTYIDSTGRMQGYHLLPNGTFMTVNIPVQDVMMTDVRGINSAGQIVGTFGTNAGTQGFVMIGGQLTPINVPGGLLTYASGINDAGHVVGHFTDPASGRARGFLYADGTFTVIDHPAGLGTFLTGINNQGQLSGIFLERFGQDGFLDRGFVASPVPVPAALLLFATGLAALGLAKRRIA